MAPETRPGRRGRQSEARRNDEAVLAAARVVFAAQGPEAPVALLAKQAGVGIASLYRRFPSKDALLQHLCHASLVEEAAIADHAAREHPTAGAALAAFIERSVQTRVGALIGLAGSFDPTPETVDAARAVHARVERLVTAAQAEGALRDDVTAIDIHSLISVFSRRPEGETDHVRLLGIALDGLGIGDRTLPSHTRDWETYEARWRGKTDRTETGE